MKHLFTSLLMVLALFAPMQAQADPPKDAPVESPAMKKSITIGYPAGDIEPVGRKAVEDELKVVYEIEVVKWRPSNAKDAEVKILELSPELESSKEEILEIILNFGIDGWIGEDEENEH